MSFVKHYLSASCAFGSKSCSGALGTGDLIGIGQDQIRKMVNDKYGYLGIVGEPFNELMYDLSSLNEVHDQVKKELNLHLAPEREKELYQQYLDKRKSVAQMWSFT